MPGSWLANETPVTPGVCRNASINRACSANRCSANRLRSADRASAESRGSGVRLGRVSLERDDVVRVEPHRHAAQVAQVDDENGRRRQEREGEGDFGDDERLRQAPRRRAG